MRLRLFGFAWTILILVSATVADETHPLGNLSISIDNGPAEAFPILNALLSRNVSVGYDSTVMVESKESREILFYPEIRKGNKNVLEIVAGTRSKKSENFYDLYINLGDTIPDSVKYVNQQGDVFLTYNGIARASRPQSENINGVVRFEGGKKEERAAGDIDLRFTMPPFVIDSLAHDFHIEGNFRVAVGEYRKLSLASATTNEQLKKKYRKNIYLAVIATIFVLAIFGLK